MTGLAGAYSSFLSHPAFAFSACPFPARSVHTWPFSLSERGIALSRIHFDASERDVLVFTSSALVDQCISLDANYAAPEQWGV